MEKPKKKKTRSQLIAEMGRLEEKLSEDQIFAPQTFVTDVTPEAMQTTLVEQKERSSILTDEGNLFDIMSGLYTSGRQNLDVFLQGHAGGPLRVRRRGREVHLNKIAITIGLAVQPAVLSEQREADQRKFRGKGLLARFQFCLPKSNIGTRDVTNRAPIPAKVKFAYYEGIKALLNKRPVFDETGREIPEIIRLNEEALDTWHKFSQWLENNQGAGGKYEPLQDFTGKLPGGALRIAGLCHAAEKLGPKPTSLSALSSLPLGEQKQHNVIDKDTITPILKLCEGLIIHAMAAFDLMGDDPAIGDAKHALKWLLSNARQDQKGAWFIKQNDLHCTPKFKSSKAERVIKALDVLRERNIISAQFKLATKKPTLVYYVNPAVMRNSEQAA